MHTRTSDFHIPFSKSSPEIAIFDRVLYIPPTCDRTQFQFPGWGDPSIFGPEGSQKPIAIEFCSGNGSWILDKARTHPDWNWVAVEKRFDRVRKIWTKMKNMGLDNLFIVFGEALAFSNSYIPPESVQKLYVNFPDPWPKNRHAKNRLISPLFFNEAAKMIQPQGQLIFVTDDPLYSAWFEQQYSIWNRGLFDLGSPIKEPPGDYGTSFFDALFRSQGKTICYHEHVRTDMTISSNIEGLPSTGVLSMNSYPGEAAFVRSRNFS